MFRRSWVQFLSGTQILSFSHTCHVDQFTSLKFTIFNHLSLSEGLKSLKWPPIADKLFFNDSVMVHMCLIGRVPDYLSQKFTRRQDLHNRNTGNKKDLNLPRCRLTTGQGSFAYRGAACWNSLPKDLTEVADVRIFKRRLVNMLLA